MSQSGFFGHFWRLQYQEGFFVSCALTRVAKNTSVRGEENAQETSQQVYLDEVLGRTEKVAALQAPMCFNTIDESGRTAPHYMKCVQEPGPASVFISRMFSNRACFFDVHGGSRPCLIIAVHAHVLFMILVVHAHVFHNHGGSCSCLFMAMVGHAHSI